MSNNRGKMISVEPRHDFEGRVSDAFYQGIVSASCLELTSLPVKTLDAAEKTPNMVRHPDRMLCTRAWIICCKHCKTCESIFES